jgi:hypothetical protein
MGNAGCCNKAQGEAIVWATSGDKPPDAVDVRGFRGGATDEGKLDEALDVQRQLFEVTLETNENATRIGVTVSPDDNPRHLVVDAVTEPGLVADWNKRQDESKKVRPGDRIVIVNGVQSDSKRMLQELQAAMRNTRLTFTVDGVLKLELPNGAGKKEALPEPLSEPSERPPLPPPPGKALPPGEAEGGNKEKKLTAKAIDATRGPVEEQQQGGSSSSSEGYQRVDGEQSDSVDKLGPLKEYLRKPISKPAQGPAGEPQRPLFEVTLKRIGEYEKRIGLIVSPDDNPRHLVVDRVLEQSLVSDWNRQKDALKRVRPGDVILSVNGISGRNEQMIEELQSCAEGSTVTLTIDGIPSSMGTSASDKDQRGSAQKGADDIPRSGRRPHRSSGGAPASRGQPGGAQSSHV